MLVAGSCAHACICHELPHKSWIKLMIPEPNAFFCLLQSTEKPFFACCANIQRRAIQTCPCHGLSLQVLQQLRLLAAELPCFYYIKPLL